MLHFNISTVVYLKYVKAGRSTTVDQVGNSPKFLSKCRHFALRAGVNPSAPPLPAGDRLRRPVGDPPQTGGGADRGRVPDGGAPAAATDCGRLPGDPGTDAGPAGGEEDPGLVGLRGPQLGHPPDAPRRGQQRVWHRRPREALQDAVAARRAGSHVPRRHHHHHQPVQPARDRSTEAGGPVLSPPHKHANRPR